MRGDGVVLDEQVARQQPRRIETANLDPVEKEKNLVGICTLHPDQPLRRVLDHLWRQVARGGGPTIHSNRHEQPVPKSSAKK